MMRRKRDLAASAPEQALHAGTQFELFLAEASTELTTCAPEDVPAALESLLGRLGSLLQVDHAFLVDRRDREESGTAVWFWNANPGPDSAPVVRAIRAKLAWIGRRAGEGDDVLLESAADVPDAYRTAGVQALAILPLQVGGRHVGALGFAASRAPRTWPAGLLRRARLVGDLFAASILRGHADRSLERGSRFERLVSDLTAILLDPPDGDPDLEVDDALQAFGEVGPADRVLLYRVSGGGARLDLARTWTDPAAGAPAADGAAREGSLRWITRQLARGEDVVVPRVADLPGAAARERRHFQRLGTRSFVRIPLQLGGVLYGVLGLDSVTAERDWSDDLRERLRFAGRVLVWAMQGGRPGPTVVTGSRFDAPVSAAPAPSGLPAALPALDQLPAGSTVLVLGDTGRGREIVVRTPLAPDPASAAWELADLVEPTAAPPLPQRAGSLRDVERAHMLRVLDSCDWRINGRDNAAERLGLKPSTLRYRMKKLGIERPEA